MSDRVFTSKRRVIVLGASTAGKTTFSRLLVERYHLSHVPVDPIIEGFESVYPSLGITHAAITHREHLKICRAFGPFLFRMIDGLVGECDHVVEGFRMPFEELVRRYRGTHQFFVFGFPHLRVREKLAQIRRHDTDSWTNAESDERLTGTLRFLIDESRRLEQASRRLKIPFFDTGKDFWKGIEAALSRVI